MDVNFPPSAMPGVNEALSVSVGSRDLLLEVHELRGPTRVRAIALGPTDGVARGSRVERTCKPVCVPVGSSTLGRMFDALGEAIDGLGPLTTAERRSIYHHTAVAARPREPMSRLTTGIKAIDLLAPVAHAGTTGIIGGAGIGKTILLQELTRGMSYKKGSVVVFAGIGERTRRERFVAGNALEWQSAPA